MGNTSPGVNFYRRVEELRYRFVHIHSGCGSIAVHHNQLDDTRGQLTGQHDGVTIGVKIITEEHPCFGEIFFITPVALELLPDITENEEALMLLKKI